MIAVKKVVLAAGGNALARRIIKYHVARIRSIMSSEFDVPGIRHCANDASYASNWVDHPRALENDQMPSLELKIGPSVETRELASLGHGAKDQYTGVPVPILCPHCGANGSFAPDVGGAMAYALRVEGYASNFSVKLWFGVRHCPNPICKGPVFTIEQYGKLLLAFPPQTIDFDTTSVPARVATSLKEAIECHAAGCFRGAALLSRRTLEEICEDRGAKGTDLKKRIAALGSLITVPKALIEAMDEIRLLGNDAAHVEAKTYDDVGSEEVEIAIALCKELVKATYQYDDLVGKIRAFQKSN